MGDRHAGTLGRPVQLAAVDEAASVAHAREPLVCHVRTGRASDTRLRGRSHQAVQGGMRLFLEPTPLTRKSNRSTRTIWLKGVFLNAGSQRILHGIGTLVEERPCSRAASRGRTGEKKAVHEARPNGVANITPRHRSAPPDGAVGGLPTHSRVASIPQGMRRSCAPTVLAKNHSRKPPQMPCPSQDVRS